MGLSLKHDQHNPFKNMYRYIQKIVGTVADQQRPGIYNQLSSPKGAT